jgi:hypothetical protein
MERSMTVRAAQLLALAFALAMVPAAASQPLQSPSAQAAQADCLAAADSPPCGYIVPQISLEFPDKPPCRAATLGGPVDLSACLALPAVGGQAVQQGLMRFSWDISQDGTYPPDASCAAPGTPCIVITFSGTATNPKWTGLTVDPPQVVLEAADFASPDNLQVNQETQQVIFMLEVPLTVTFQREGVGDDADSQRRIERAQGAVQMFLKAKSSANGQYYKEAFGVEEFRFNPCANDDGLRDLVSQCDGQPLADGTTPPGASNDTPGLGAVGALGVLAAVGVAIRRRRD